MVTRRWVINGALQTGCPLFCRDDDSVIHILDDMAKFNYHRYWDLTPQIWSHQDPQDTYYPDFSDQPFELQEEEVICSQLIMHSLEDMVSKYVVMNERAIEDLNNSRCHLEEKIENLKISILHEHQEHGVKKDTQTVIPQIWFDDDDLENHDLECESIHAEDQEVFESSLPIEPQQEEVLKATIYADTPPTQISQEFVLREPTEMFSSHVYQLLLSIVEVTSINCLHLAKLEGTCNKHPLVVSYDTYFGRQPLFDECF
ncbi:uncharacterized protein [Henckelia pumila]|uniref:uncharacterized protein n=1 Tax=Henckelia pumila TaxID=405737 RepID=UPI003C6DB861